MHFFVIFEQVSVIVLIIMVKVCINTSICVWIKCNNNYFNVISLTIFYVLLCWLIYFPSILLLLISVIFKNKTSTWYKKATRLRIVLTCSVDINAMHLYNERYLKQHVVSEFSIEKLQKIGLIVFIRPAELWDKVTFHLVRYIYYIYCNLCLHGLNLNFKQTFYFTYIWLSNAKVSPILYNIDFKYIVQFEKKDDVSHI